MYRKSGMLYIPSINTTAFGNKSLRYNTPVVWNKLLKTNPEISNEFSKIYFEILLSKDLFRFTAYQLISISILICYFSCLI